MALCQQLAISLLLFLSSANDDSSHLSPSARVSIAVLRAGLQLVHVALLIDALKHSHLFKSGCHFCNVEDIDRAQCMAFAT
jgi:hypothetical protein